LFFNSSIFLGLNEKKAISEPDISALQISKRKRNINAIIILEVIGFSIARKKIIVSRLGKSIYGLFKNIY